MLIKDDFVHGLGKININFIQEGSCVSRRLATQGFGVLSHLEDTVGLVCVNLWDLMLWHVINVVVILDKSVSMLSLLMGGSKAARENFGVLILKVNEDTSKAHFLTSVFPEALITVCFRTLTRYGEVITAHQKIRQECNDVASKDIYNPNITKTMKVDEFK
jgi:hypothetical protein